MYVMHFFHARPVGLGAYRTRTGLVAGDTGDDVTPGVAVEEKGRRKEAATSVGRSYGVKASNACRRRAMNCAPFRSSIA